MGKIISGLISGIIFGVGLTLSGMTLPSKVIGFLDVAGDWDPSLAMVMMGAIGVYAPAYRWLIGNTTPLFARAFMAQAAKRIDAPLLTGAAIFGFGWGMAGYCPGPALTAAGTGASQALLFTLAMLAAMLAHSLWERMRMARSVPETNATPSAS